MTTPEPFTAPEQLSRSRVSTISEGLETSADRRVWIAAAQSRIEELDYRAALGTLEPHEAEEAAALARLLETFAPAAGR